MNTPLYICRTKYDQFGSNKDDLNDFLYIESLNALAEDFLVRNDKLGMAHSMEGRFPILNKRLRDYVRAVPSKLKVDPLFFKRPNSHIFVPSASFVKVAVGNIFIFDLSRPLLWMKSTIDTLSITGLVLGIVTTDVIPPAKAASLKDL